MFGVIQQSTGFGSCSKFLEDIIRRRGIVEDKESFSVVFHHGLRRSQLLLLRFLFFGRLFLLRRHGAMFIEKIVPCCTPPEPTFRELLASGAPEFC